MAGDQSQIGHGPADPLGCFATYIMMTGAMEAVFANFHLLAESEGKCIETGLRGNRGVKSRIENRYLGNVREPGFTGQDAFQIRWIVQRGQVKTVLDDLLDPVIDQCRPADVLPAMDDPVPDGPDLFL